MPRKLQSNKPLNAGTAEELPHLRKPCIAATNKRIGKAHSSSIPAAGRKVCLSKAKSKGTIKVPKIKQSSPTSIGQPPNSDRDKNHNGPSPATEATSIVPHNEPHDGCHRQQTPRLLLPSEEDKPQDLLGLRSSSVKEEDVKEGQKGRELCLSDPRGSSASSLSTGPLEVKHKNTGGGGQPHQGTTSSSFSSSSSSSSGGFTTLLHPTSISSSTPATLKAMSGVAALPESARTKRDAGEIIAAGKSSGRAPQEPTKLPLEHSSREAVHTTAGAALGVRPSKGASSSLTATPDVVEDRDDLGGSPLHELSLWFSEKASAEGGVPPQLSLASLQEDGVGVKVGAAFVNAAHHQILTLGGDGSPKAAFEGHKRGRSGKEEEGNAIKDSLLSAISRVRIDFGGLIALKEHNAPLQHESFPHLIEKVEGERVKTTQKRKSSTPRPTDIPSGVSSTHKDQNIVNKGAHGKVSEKRKVQLGTKQLKHSGTSISRNNDDADRCANDAPLAAPSSTELQTCGREPAIRVAAMDFPVISENGSTGVDMKIEAEPIFCGGNHDGDLKMSACGTKMTVVTSLEVQGAGRLEQEEPKPPIGPTNSAEAGKLERHEVGGPHVFFPQESPRDTGGTPLLVGRPKSSPSGPSPHSRLLPPKGVQPSPNPPSTPALSARHRLRPLHAVPIRALDGFTTVDGPAFLAHTRAEGAHVAFCEPLSAAAASGAPPAGLLGRLRAQTQRRAEVREDMVRGLLLTLSSDALFGDPLSSGVATLQQVLRAQRHYGGGIGPLRAFPRDVPAPLLPVSGAVLRRAHARINGAGGGPDAAPIPSSPARYTTRREGIPPAPYIEIEHTYRCRGSFIPQVALSGASSPPTESDMRNPTTRHDGVETEKGVVAVDVSASLPIERGRPTVSSSSLPLVGLNPDGDLHHPMYPRLCSLNVKDGSGSEDVDAVPTEVAQSDQNIPTKTRPGRSTQRDSDGRVGAGQGPSPTFAAPYKVAAEPWAANPRNSIGPMDIDSVLRRGEHYIKRIPMPDTEWRYGPFG